MPIYNRALSPRPTLVWRIVRRVGARLRWRALWRRGMRRVMWMPRHSNCRCSTLPIYFSGYPVLFDDLAAIESDWRAVGDDIQAALNRYQAEYFSKSVFSVPKDHDD